MPAATRRSLCWVRCTRTAPVSAERAHSDARGFSSAAAARGSSCMPGCGSLVTSSDWTTTRMRLVDRLDLVGDRRDRALGERDEAGRADLDGLAGGRAPLHLAVQGPRPEVELALVGPQLAVADVEGLVPDQQPDHLAVGDVDHGLAHLGLAVGGLGVGQRALLVEAVQVGAGQRQRLALVEVAAQADVPVGEREHRLGLRQEVEVEARSRSDQGSTANSAWSDHFALEQLREVVDHDVGAVLLQLVAPGRPGRRRRRSRSCRPVPTRRPRGRPRRPPPAAGSTPSCFAA